MRFNQPSWNTQRLTFLVGMLEIGLGTAIYAARDEFTYLMTGRSIAPLTSCLFLAGGVLLLVMLRYPLPLWIRRVIGVAAAVPLALVAWRLGLIDEQVGRFVFGSMSLATVLIGLLQQHEGSAGHTDLLDRAFGFLMAIGGLSMLLYPTLYQDPIFVPLAEHIRIVGVLAVVAAVGLLAPTWLRRRSGWLPMLGRTAAIVLLLLFAAVFLYQALATGIVFCLVSALGLSLRRTAFLNPAAHSIGGGDDLVLGVERYVEAWTWVLMPGTVAIALVEDVSQVRLLFPVSLFVIGMSIYNVFAFWVFPTVGSPRRRLLVHLLVLSIGLYLLALSNNAISYAAEVLLVVPPMLAARALGQRAGYGMAALGALLLVHVHVAPTVYTPGGADIGPRLLIMLLIHSTASVAVVRSSDQQRRLTSQLLRAKAQLQAKNEDLQQATLALTRLANWDSLTSLVNRRHFQERLQLELLNAKRTRVGGAVLYLDLNGFKQVNDRMGHAAGDRLLERVAQILVMHAPEPNIAARLGGDEFAIILPGADAAAAERTANAILNALREERVPLHGRAVPISASLGYTLYPSQGQTVETLLVNADQAMYAVKSTGRDGARMFEEGGRTDHQWEAEIRAALESDRFVLHFQPIVDLRTGLVDRYEALVRMRDTDGGLIAPGAFLPVAERMPVIHEIDRWVVQRSIHILAQHHERGSEIRLEVNLSGRAFEDPHLLPLIERLFRESGVAPASVIFEITETAAIADLDRARSFIETLRGLGCRFAIDDFGAGFASVGYLRNLPVDYLKIDGSFIQGLGQQEEYQHLVAGMVSLARGFRARTIAEWVDDGETLALLSRLGVDMAQGFGVGRPAPEMPDMAPPPGAAPAK